jgi:hypothetical protein
MEWTKRGYIDVSGSGTYIANPRTRFLRNVEIRRTTEVAFLYETGDP